MVDYTRREILGSIAGGTALGLSGCTGQKPEETTTLEEGEYSWGVMLEEVNENEETASIDYIAGPEPEEFKEGEPVLCDKTEEEEYALHLDDINYDQQEITLRKEKGCP